MFLRVYVCAYVLSTLTDHGGAPGQSSLGPLGEVIHRRGAQVWLQQAGVDVYPTREHHTPLGLHHLHSPWNYQVLPHLSIGYKGGGALRWDW